MARHIPYVFCRYEICIEDELLGLRGQRQFIKEFQGQDFVHRRQTSSRAQTLGLIMEPGEFNSDGEICLTWDVGFKPGVRTETQYDPLSQKKQHTIVQNSHIRYAPMIALPERGVMAIEDRANDERIPARQAINVFRSIARELGDGGGSFDVHHGEPGEVQRWLQEWDLKEYTYTVSPLNPISAGRYATKRSDAMKAENAARELGKVEPPAGQAMTPNGGVISEVEELNEVGYAQRGFRVQTPDGHVAHVRV